ASTRCNRRTRVRIGSARSSARFSKTRPTSWWICESRRERGTSRHWAGSHDPGPHRRAPPTLPEGASGLKKLLDVALGILTAIGGFVDIGELVTAPAVGARFGMTLAWASVLSLLGIMIFSEMSGRVAAMSGRPVFDL